MQPGDDVEHPVGSIEPLLGYLAVVARNLMARDKAGLEGASDLVQLTVVAALDNIGKGRVPGADEGEMKAWLRGIMLNIRRQLWRRRSPAVPPALGDVGADSSSPSTKASREELAARMAEARGRLDERDRQILYWRHRDQLTLQAIGERLGVSAAAAHKAHHRALKRLEDAFLEIAAATAYRQTRERLKAVHRGEVPSSGA
jgi:RNA polymerase sigma-70 factor (ECF subfamily)